MASQHKIQAYMDKHRLEGLFEDLMNKTLLDMPEDPTVYLIKCLYKKAGLDIPQDIRFGGASRSKDFTRSRTPDRSRMKTSVSADEGLTRDYEKPWQTTSSPSKRTKPKTEAGRRSPSKQVNWNTDTKVKATSFDELFEDPSLPRQDVPVATRKRSDVSPDKRTLLSTNILGNVFSSVDSSSRVKDLGSLLRVSSRLLETDSDPLAGELQPVTSKPEEKTETSTSSRTRRPRLEAKKHRQDLEKMLRKSDDRSPDSGYEDKSVSDGDDAIELLEDSEELKKEGVRHVSKDGYKLSRISRQRTLEPKVKLNINLCPQSAQSYPSFGKSPGFNVDDSDTEDRPQTGRRTVVDSDEEFESVSQVTGPREPVWNLKDGTDSDVDTYGGGSRRRVPSARSNRHGYKDRWIDMASTLPARASAHNVSDFLQKAGETWTAGLDEQRSGRVWDVPSDSDVSQSEFTKTTGSRPSKDPRSY